MPSETSLSFSVYHTRPPDVGHLNDKSSAQAWTELATLLPRLEQEHQGATIVGLSLLYDILFTHGCKVVIGEVTPADCLSASAFFIRQARRGSSAARSLDRS